MDKNKITLQSSHSKVSTVVGQSVRQQLPGAPISRIGGLHASQHAPDTSMAVFKAGGGSRSVSKKGSLDATTYDRQLLS